MSSTGLTPQEAIRLAFNHYQAMRFAEAASVCAQLLRAVPNHFDALHLSAILAQQRGDIATALDFYKKSLAVRADVGVYLNFGAALVQAGKLEHGANAFLQVLKKEPRNVAALGNLALTLHNLGRHKDAIALFRQLESLTAVSADISAAHGAALLKMNCHKDAEVPLRRALEQKPDDAKLRGNLALSLMSQGKYAEAETILRRAIELDPQEPVLRNNFAITLANQGKQAEATAFALRTLSENSAIAYAHSPLVYTLTFDAALTPETYLEQARVFGESATRRATPYTKWKDTPDGKDRKTLRVGFVSGDFRLHPVGYFLENFMAKIDPARVQLIAYTTFADEDELTARLKPLFAEWHDISLLDDAAAAKKIHDDGIHVLVDLAGHTTWNRLPMLAWKPAPVQVSWLGYSASTGLQAVDWLIVDAASAPENEQDLYSERLWYLPSSRICFTPPDDGGEVGALPAMRNGYVTFGSFQNMTKIGDNMLSLWARVLAAVPLSKLRVQNGELSADESRERFLQRAESLGIPRDRVITAGKMPRADYLAAHAEVDFILDTFPYPGGTTTCEALWMGVPTLVRAGRTLLSRYGASVLAACDLTDWIAESDDEYVALAVKHAADIKNLQTLRANLREQVRNSALCDGAGFARRLEDALHGMWCDMWRDAGSGESGKRNPS